MKKIVIPGELISQERKRLGSNVFVSNGKVYASVVGVSDDTKEVASVVPLEGKYIPKSEDSIIGIVKRAIHAGYIVDVNSFVESFIPRSAVRDELRVGDVIFAKVAGVKENKEADLAYPKRAFGGEVISMNAVRSPRLIGKNGSMLDLLTQGSKSEIFVGKNGRVWAKDGNIELLKELISFVDNNSYKSNLTSAVEARVKGKVN